MGLWQAMKLHISYKNPFLPFLFLSLSIFIYDFREVKLLFAIISLILSCYQIINLIIKAENIKIFAAIMLNLYFVIALYSIFMIILALFWR